MYYFSNGQRWVWYRLNPKVFLDATILYSGTCRSLFIWLHTNNVVEIYWTQEAWNEVFRNFSKKNEPDLSAKFKRSMQKNVINEFTECLISLELFTPIGLKDKDDEHILAAAVQINAKYLLTNDEVLLKENLPNSMKVILIKPDDFLVEIALINSPQLVLDAVESHQNSLKTSRPDKTKYLESLKKAGLVKFSRFINTYKLK